MLGSAAAVPCLTEHTRSSQNSTEADADRPVTAAPGFRHHVGRGPALRAVAGSLLSLPKGHSGHVTLVLIKGSFEGHT